jgi:hypothetical protein
MFIKNKYFKWYYSIIEKRKNFPYTEEYAEGHHIIPKSLGGSNEKDNIVKMSAREHFLCHMFLFRMTEGKNKIKMSYAIRCMTRLENFNQKRYKINSRTYSNIIRNTKKSVGEALSGENNPFYGKTHSNLSKQKMRLKRSSQIPPMLGKKHSEETKLKLKNANIKQFSDPEQKKIRREKNAIWFSNPENRKNAGNGSRGTSWYYNPNTKISVKALPGKQPEGYIKGRILKKEA